MRDLTKTFIYRITHIDNITHILKNGITHARSPKANPDFVPIGDPDLIGRRSAYVLRNGKRIGEYIPFYFGCRMPMLYVIQRGFNSIPITSAADIVYCVSSVQDIVDSGLDFAFTDGHAISSLTTQYFAEDLDKLMEVIDFDAVSAIYWKDESDLDLKRRKEAEFLVVGDIPASAVRGFIVYDNDARSKLIRIGTNESHVHVRPERYF